MARETQAKRLWEWASEQEDFTSVEAANATGVKVENVWQYLKIWRRAGAVKVVSPNDPERTGRFIYVVVKGRKRPSAFVAPVRS